MASQYHGIHHLAQPHYRLKSTHLSPRSRRSLRAILPPTSWFNCRAVAIDQRKSSNLVPWSQGLRPPNTPGLVVPIGAVERGGRRPGPEAAGARSGGRVMWAANRLVSRNTGWHFPETSGGLQHLVTPAPLILGVPTSHSNLYAMAQCSKDNWHIEQLDFIEPY